MEYIPFFRFRTENTEVAIAAAVLLFVAGLVALLYGWKLYRLLLVISVGLAAGYVGWYFLHTKVSGAAAFLIPLFVGLLGALIAIPVQKAVVFLLGAAAGFLTLGPLAAELIWRAPEGPTPTQYLITAAVAFVAAGILAVLLLKPAMMIATSMLGAALLVSAAVHLYEALAAPPRSTFSRYPQYVALVYAVLVIAGVIFQTSSSRPAEEDD
jgi:hypothetical protein